jgi:hypothetical protein
LLQIIYFRGPVANLYLNLSGNALDDAIPMDALVPVFDNLTAVTAVDLLGSGTTCLVWSSSHPSDSGTHALKYVDLTSGVKPHLLTNVVNNTGKETQLFYAPSTMYYLQDEAAGNPWATRLPFPHHCVDRIITLDHITNRTYTQRYRYHHGYYDGLEREFRGFGMVEEWDTERFRLLGWRGRFANINEETHTPPMHTKSWFHTGAYPDHEALSRLYARNEYFHAPGINVSDHEGIFTTQLRDVILSSDEALTPEELRQASRALKGSLLRQEIYADDDNEKSSIPYQITDNGSNVTLVQPCGQTNPYAVFYPYVRENLNYMYERQTADPRIKHELVLEKDWFGNTLAAASVGYGRALIDPELTAADQTMQSTTKIIFIDQVFTNEIDNAQDGYRLPMACGTKSYEVTGLDPTGPSGRFTTTDFSKVPTIAEIPYDQPPAPDGVPAQKRILKARETRFRKNDLTTLLPTGQLESLGLVGQTYDLCLTPSILTALRRDNKDLLPDASTILTQTGGFIDYKSDKSLWNSSALVGATFSHSNFFLAKSH